MKKYATIAQWFFAILSGCATLGNGMHWSSLFWLLATVLLLPIPAVRKRLNKLKLKNGLVITLAVVALFVGAMFSPAVKEENAPNGIKQELSENGTESIETEENPTDENTAPDNANTEDSGTQDDTVVDDPDNKDDPAEDDPVIDDPDDNDDPAEDDPVIDDPNDNDNPAEDDPVIDDPNDNDNPAEDDDVVDSPDDNDNPTPEQVGNGIANPVNPATIPAYSGSPYIVIDNNVPSFGKAELTTIAYELYSKLDELGRCGVAVASCGKEIMPGEDEQRGSISSVIPTGWIQASYEGVSGGYLWNRCHLIGWQLSAENANKQNLITGTRYMNVNGMLPFENMVADYITETGNHVAFRVTPIFEGDNLVCSGVQIEAYSIEDNGEGIQFNVYCYNVQPGIVIDYATGNSYADLSFEDAPTEGEDENDDVVDDSQDNKDPVEDEDIAPDDPAIEDATLVWIPKSGKKYHTDPTCSNMKDPTQVTKDEAEKQGYEPCKKC